MEAWKQNRNKATIILCLINIGVFLGLIWNGMTEDVTYMVQHGAMYVPLVIENQEYYRLFTSMFMHFSIQHLGNNMILLFLMGRELEQEMGWIKYLLVYFLSGLAGNLLSMTGDILTKSFVVSAGASGAIYGVIGGMFWVVIRNKGKFGNITSRGLLFMIGISLYYGLTSTGVDNLAHIGGLVSGFLLTIFLYHKSHRESSLFVGDGSNR